MQIYCIYVYKLQGKYHTLSVLTIKTGQDRKHAWIGFLNNAFLNVYLVASLIQLNHDLVATLLLNRSAYFIKI